ncbi:MAG: SDR family NAD(P)-dependent oxidoreductase [Opitutales bacterium]|nr:SDR family NAD(P)-dependent oxidoreductase [Opitutales bacterium]
MKKTVFITGVSRGLGRALAAAYLDDGCAVYGCSRSGCDLADAHPGRYHDKALDLSDSGGGPAALAEWLCSGPGFDLAILNAGILPEIRDIKDTPLESLRETMEINLWSNKWVLDALLAMPRKPGHIVAISSGAAVSGSRGWNGYALSKAALNMLVRLYAAEEPEVHFTAFAPGLIDTAMQDYLCGIEDDAGFETVRRLKQARHTPDMPKPEEAARKITAVLDTLPRTSESGAFVDIRKMETYETSQPSLSQKKTKRKLTQNDPRKHSPGFRPSR